ncbi:MAG: hypothetical protein QM770_07415 [Tepidisphaeraceae bacterium]
MRLMNNLKPSPGPGVAGRLIALSTLSVLAAASSARADLDLRTIRAYHVGNSVTDTITYTSLQPMIAATGNTYVYGRQTIAGTPLSGIWANPNKGFTTAPYNHYTTALPNYTWDAVTLQPFDRMMYGFPDADLPAVRQFIDLTLTNPANAATQFYIYERWPRRNEITNPDGTKSYPAFDYQYMFDRAYTHMNWGNSFETYNTNETRDYFTQLLKLTRDSYPNLQKTPLMVPVGDVLYELDKRLRTGIIPECPDISGIYVDAIHFGDLGRFAVGTTFFATMYATDPHGMSASSYKSTQIHPGQAAKIEVTDTRWVNLVQDVVWDVVRTHPYAIGGAPTYSIDADGDWLNRLSWTRGEIPNSPTAVAKLGYYNKVLRTVTLSDDVKLAQLQIDSPSGYAIAGPGSLTISPATGTDAITVSARTPPVNIGSAVTVLGDSRLSLATGQQVSIAGKLTVTGRHTQSGGTLAVNELDMGSLLISTGTVKLTGTTSTPASRVGELRIGRDAKFDVGLSQIIVDYGDGDVSPMIRLTADLAAGRLYSSQPTGPDGATTLVLVDNTNAAVAVFGGHTVDNTAVLLERTLVGDATANRAVDFSDLLAVASAIHEGENAGWQSGDFNGDGVVDAGDVGAIEANYGSVLSSDGAISVDATVAANFSTDWALAQSIVPEPTALAASIIGVTLILRRRAR